MSNLTNTHISFLSTIDRSAQLDKSEKYYYFNLFNWKIEVITIFLSKIKDNEVYLIFPFITTSKKPNLPYLRLSESFLVNNKSNPDLISNFLTSQWAEAGFEVCEGENVWFYLKYKRVYLNPLTPINYF